MKEIPEFEGYKIDENSNVYSVFLKRFMKPKINNGYKSVGLRKNGKYLWINCHRLAAITYLSPPINYKELQVCHNDGNKDNNHISNLRWATPKDNTNDKYAHGTAFNCNEGEMHHAAKLNKILVAKLRELAKSMDCMELSILFGIPKLTIYDAVTGKTWKIVNNDCPPVSLSGRQYKQTKLKHG